ncbi:MAG: dipeptide/oligopeptide/nickel ABC transporter ATP-binding protein, partial [Firmicutes bacterium]|nr:dipeptide/oligopeptide/nickel ABC transporter ATP-binding protein [Bacillota bacterium]
MIELKDVGKTFVMKKGSGSRKRKIVRAVQNVELEWRPGDFIAIVGESGCGKSTLGRMIAGIITPSDGELLWDGNEIRYLRGDARRAWSRTAQLIPQDPYAALNPVRKIRSSFADPLLYHHMVPRNRVEDRMAELLRLVGLEPDNVIDKYPHELSGGQRQRVVVARALTVEPGYLIADEAVSMVDVSLRLGIMNRIKEISQTRDLGLMFITHDFRVARYIAQGGQILVMYLGRVIERGPAEEVLRRP